MRIARVITAFDGFDAGLDRQVETADLDVLQLDYHWPSSNPTGVEPWKGYATGFLEQLRTLHKTLYLEPRLHLVTNAGGSDTLGCVDALADFLCEHGDATLPITAIRGDNVLARLEEMVAEGIELQDLATGTSLYEMSQPLLAAQIELGAGPFATAWDEGSRLVVAGCYDFVAPVIAAASSGLKWSWDRYEELSKVAVAARLPHRWVDIDEAGEVLFHPNSDDLPDDQQLREWLLRSATNDGTIHHADVHCQVAEFQTREKRLGSIPIAGVTGRPASGHWRLRLTCRTGYCAEAFFEFSKHVTDATVERTVQSLQSRLHIEDDQDRAIQLDQLLASGDDVPRLIRIGCRSQQREPCEAWVRDMGNYSLRCGIQHCELTGLSPQLQQTTGQIWCQVPREAIAISVDTRPAKEWR